MTPRSPRQQQYDNRSWQCQIESWDASHHDGQPYNHVCGLNKGHFPPCLCWCGWAFRDYKELWQQQPLPGLWMDIRYRPRG